MDISPLAQLEDLDGYRRLFADGAFWTPYAQEVCLRHRLEPCFPTRVGVPGTCPAVIVAERWVVKFFGRLFEGGQSFAVEQEAARLVGDDLDIPTARVRASGELAPGEDWPWPYLVFDFIPGKSIGEQFEQVSPADLLRVARELGAAARRLHAIPLGNSTVFPNSHREYRALLEAQRAGCSDRHQGWGSLPRHLISQIDDFLPATDELIDENRPPHLIHADLTRDHLLGRIVEDRWQTLALIDFGDAMTGDLLYELIALHLDLFCGEKALLAAFLEAYGYPREAYPPLPRQALATALLHRFNVFAGLPVEMLRVRTLQELAQDLWGM
jgi:hygromycin-B 7''-O-kinase